MIAFWIAVGIVIGQPPIMIPLSFCVAFPFLWFGQYIEGKRAKRCLASK